MVEGTFSLGYLVFNDHEPHPKDTQVACFRNVAAHLETGGIFVVETSVPDPQRFPPGETDRPFLISDDRWGFDEYDVVSKASCPIISRL